MSRWKALAESIKGGAEEKKQPSKLPPNKPRQTRTHQKHKIRHSQSYTEANFPFHKFDGSDAKVLFDNICNKPCVSVETDPQNHKQLRTLKLCRDAYESGDKLIYFYTEHALIHATIKGKKTPLHHWLRRNNSSMPFPKSKSQLREARDAIWRLGEPSVFSAFWSKVIFDHFKPRTVFDPCAGWGARAIGALASKHVERYVASDINDRLFEEKPDGFGYPALKKDLDLNDKLIFFNCSILDLEVEKTKPKVPPRQGNIPKEYDLIFTSPPFYEYEIYNTKYSYKDERDESELIYPTYEDWQVKFYLPFCKKLRSLIKPNGVVALHVGSTWISPGLPEVTQTIMQEAGFIFDYQFIFDSTKQIPVLIFKPK